MRSLTSTLDRLHWAQLDGVEFQDKSRPERVQILTTIVYRFSNHQLTLPSFTSTRLKVHKVQHLGKLVRSWCEWQNDNAGQLRS